MTFMCSARGRLGCRNSAVLLCLWVFGAPTLGCGRTRPASVSPAAVWFPMGRLGGWAHCWMDPAARVNRCRVYNGDGQRLYSFGRDGDSDEVFIADDGSGPISDRDLRIDPD